MSNTEDSNVARNVPVRNGKRGSVRSNSVNIDPDAQSAMYSRNKKRTVAMVCFEVDGGFRSENLRDIVLVASVVIGDAGGDATYK